MKAARARRANDSMVFDDVMAYVAKRWRLMSLA